MKRILIHSIVFHPDAVSTAYLYADIAKGLKDLGYEVQVITTTPHYNVLKDQVGREGLKRKLFGLYYYSVYEGIKVYHIPAVKSRNILLRLFSFVYFHFFSIIISLFIGKINVVLAPSPPLTIGLVAIIIAKIKGGEAIYNVQEIYPDFIINQGILKNRLAIKLLKSLERFIYRHSKFIVTIDELFSDIIRPRIANPEKIIVIPNFVDTQLYLEYPKVNQWSKNSPYRSKFIVMYAGNIGFAQDWEPLIFAARELAHLPIHFMIIGEGIKKDLLENLIRTLKLSNISLLEYQERKMMPFINSFADIHFITMNPSMDKEGFPSKVYSIMSSGKTLVVSTGVDTPLSSLLKRAGVGITVPENNDMAFAEAIKEYYENPGRVKEDGIKARDFIVSNYSKEIIIKKYYKLLELA